MAGVQTETLKDGSRIVLRPIAAEDRDALAAGFEQLSDQSRYRRFFGPVSRLSDRQLDYLTDVDHHDHEAVVAFADGEEDVIIGVARFVRVEEGVAEPAVAVVDAWQGRGLATLLLDALVERAREEGIGWFAAPVLAGNEPAINALRRLGREVQVRVALPAQPGVGATPPLRELLRVTAAQTVRPVTTLWQRLQSGLRPRRVTSGRNTVVAPVRAGSEEEQAAPRVAGEVARAYGAAVHLVGVQRLLLDSAGPLEAALDRAAGALRDRGVAGVTTELRRGDLAAALLDAAGAQQARLIVIEGTPPGEEPLFGSAWDHVAHHAPCDVLVVRR